MHRDYHLGQLLRTPGGFAVVDFEGEPARPLALRRQKACALRDVAGMLRSFAYAARWPCCARWVRAVSRGSPSASRRGPISGRPAFAGRHRDTWARLSIKCRFPHGDATCWRRR
jgi:hypothetical protein